MRKPKVPYASYFVFTGSEGRVRRPRDVAAAVVGLLLIIWAANGNRAEPAWVESLTDLANSSPQWVQVALSFAYLVSAIYALGVLGALLLGGRDRRSALRVVIVAMVGAIVAVVILSFLVNDAWPYVVPEMGLQSPEPRFPVMRVAIVTSMLLVASPYLTKPIRQLGWLAIFLTATASIVLGYGSPIHTIGSLGVGMVVAGTLLAAVGTPRGYPSPDAVAVGLATLGVKVHTLTARPDQHWGLVRFDAEDLTGRSIEVKVQGRDSFDSQLAAKLWRSLTYRELGRTAAYSRDQAVEHEALIGMFAAKSGVTVPEVAAVGRASPEIALIAYRGGGQPLDGMKRDLISDDLLVALWSQAAVLHQAGLSHGSLSTRTIRVLEDRPVLVDFELGTLAPDGSDRAADVVELLFSLALLVGTERSVSAAMEGLGKEPLVEALPYLQVPAVSAFSRRQVEKPKALVAELRKAVVAATGAEKFEPVKLRRVDVKSLVTALLLLLIASSLIPALVQVDYAEIWSVLQDSNWVLLVAGLIVGHLQFFPQATATMFAVPAKLPFWPLVTLQTASQFISLAVPSAAGRVAMNAAFLHRFGVSVTVAVAQGAIDGFSGFLVQVAILLVVVLTGNIDLGPDVDASDVRWLLLLAVVAVLAIVVVVVVTRVKALREKVVPVIKQAWSALMVVLRQPSRALGLLGSNFVYWNLLGITLWIILEAVGVELNFGSALFVAAGTSLLAGFMPVPGGIGVAEATMTAMLVALGVDDSAAFAATAVYRVITFYLPALEGFFGTRWLERNEYI